MKKVEFIKIFKQLSKENTGIAGGKGASLGEMLNAGIPVPPGFVVLASTFDKFIHDEDIAEEIDAQFDKINPKEMESVEEASEVIRGLIESHEMSEELKKEIMSEFDKLGAEFVAVRSSATAEDAADASWAGELESYLNVTRENVCEHVRKCWGSLFTPRAIFYRHEKKLHGKSISVAVVVQKMVQSEVSGIVFTVHPVTTDPNQMIIETGFGLGEAIVGGLITPDSYVVDKEDFSLLDINISKQEKKIVYDQNKNKNLTKKVAKDDQEKQKLAGEKIVELAKLCLKIEKHYKYPQDIEWAQESGKFYIVQSRPITTL